MTSLQTPRGQGSLLSLSPSYPRPEKGAGEVILKTRGMNWKVPGSGCRPSKWFRNSCKPLTGSGGLGSGAPVSELFFPMHSGVGAAAYFPSLRLPQGARSVAVN